jgi:GNAT superfamily N-acetyltransferase
MPAPALPEIRPYEAADREALRRLCCTTAYGERPLAELFPDPALFADLMTRYHTDWEPGSTLVARGEATAGGIAGYLCGARNTSRQRRVQALCVVPAALLRFTLRGGLLRRSTWRLIGANSDRILPRRGLGSGDLMPWLALYPAHLHIALAREARGRGLGRRLVETFLAQLAAAGVPGVHAVVREENAGAGRFFERLGFRPLARGPALRLPGDRRPGPYTVVYGRSVGARPAPGSIP